MIVHLVYHNKHGKSVGISLSKQTKPTKQKPINKVY